MYPADTINYLLALGTLGIQIATVFLIVVYFAPTFVPASERIRGFVESFGLWVAFVFALLSSLVNQFYNQGLGIPPCDLCWWGRIFLYPQIILFTMTFWCRRHIGTVADASIVLSIIGAGISLYHHLLQLFPNSIPCPATGVSCAQRFLFEFGYITYPLMAFSLFAFLIVTMLFVRRRA